MNKHEFVKKVQESLEVKSYDKADTIIDKLVETMINLLKEGEEFSLGDLGKFTAVDKPASKARNPKTGEEIDVPAKRIFKFKPSGKAKTAVAGK